MSGTARSVRSMPDAPRSDVAPRPNVLVVLLDDTGFAQLGCFGSDIATPNIDRLADGGLRYNRFHVTALCSPTRASLLGHTAALPQANTSLSSRVGKYHS